MNSTFPNASFISPLPPPPPPLQSQLNMNNELSPRDLKGSNSMMNGNSDQTTQRNKSKATLWFMSETRVIYCEIVHQLRRLDFVKASSAMQREMMARSIDPPQAFSRQNSSPIEPIGWHRRLNRSLTLTQFQVSFDESRKQRYRSMSIDRFSSFRFVFIRCCVLLRFFFFAVENKCDEKKKKICFSLES